MAKIPAMRPQASFLAAAHIIAAVIAGLWPLGSLLIQRGGSFGIGSYEIGIALFTLKQASLSTVLSVLPAIVIARSLAKADFWGRNFILTLCNLPLSIPALVAVLSFVGLFGQSGLLPAVVNLYGLTGIILIHVFFNLPMAVRLFFNVLHEAEYGHHLLAQNLGFSAWQRFRHIDWPLLQATLPQVAALIFLLCAASFVIVLTLGGVSATTLEVAIYQALRLDFDPSRAAALSVLHIAISAALVGLAHRFFVFDVRTKPGALRPPQAMGVFDIGMFIVLMLLIAPPLLSLGLAGIGHLHFSNVVLRATLTSLGLGFTTAVISVSLAWALARRGGGIAHLISLSGLLFPPAVLGMGWFLLSLNLGLGDSYTLGFIVVLNVLAALPFSYAAMRAGFAQNIMPLQRLQAQLGLEGMAGLVVVEWPLLKTFVRQAFLMAVVLSLGDLTAITLLGRGNLMTLPTLLQSEMGHYRGADAQGTALLLLILSLGLAALAHGRKASNA